MKSLLSLILVVMLLNTVAVRPASSNVYGHQVTLSGKQFQALDAPDWTITWTHVYFRFNGGDEQDAFFCFECGSPNVSFGSSSMGGGQDQNSDLAATQRFLDVYYQNTLTSEKKPEGKVYYHLTGRAMVAELQEALASKTDCSLEITRVTVIFKGRLPAWALNGWTTTYPGFPPIESNQ